MTRSLSRRPRDEDDPTPTRRMLRADVDDAPPRNLAVRTPTGDDEELPAKRPFSLLSRHRVEGGGLATIQREMGGSGGRNFSEERVELTADTKVFKFLEADPYAAMKIHWIEASPVKRKSFICLRARSSDPIGDCPLCEWEAEQAAAKGVKPSRPAFKAYFNVVEVNEEAPSVKRLEAGSILFDQLVGWAEQERTSPISKDGLYWGISRKKVVKGGNESWLFPVEPIKERDLAEDHDVEPLTPEEIDGLAGDLFTEDSVHVDSYDDLVDIVEQMRDSRTSRRAA